MPNEYTQMDVDMEFEPQADGNHDIPYFAPATLEDAERLKEAHPGAHYFAGGTILNWRGSPRGKGLIDLKDLDLEGIEVTPERIVIGAMATIQELAENRELPLPISSAASLFGSRNVRNAATAGGTATGRFFVSDLLPVFLAYQADVEFFQGNRKSITPLSQWLQDRPGIICSLIIGNPDRKVAFRQEKISSIDFPLIVTAVGWEGGGTPIAAPVVAISGATGKIALSVPGAEYLAGKEVAAVESDALNAAVQQDIQPSGTIKATPRVKRKMIESQLTSIIAELQKEGRV